MLVIHVILVIQELKILEEIRHLKVIFLCPWSSWCLHYTKNILFREPSNHLIVFAIDKLLKVMFSFKFWREYIVYIVWCVFIKLLLFCYCVRYRRQMGRSDMEWFYLWKVLVEWKIIIYVVKCDRGAMLEGDLKVRLKILPWFQIRSLFECFSYKTSVSFNLKVAFSLVFYISRTHSPDVICLRGTAE